jgi:hypothetical protein
VGFNLTQYSSIRLLMSLSSAIRFASSGLSMHRFSLSSMPCCLLLPRRNITRNLSIERRMIEASFSITSSVTNSLRVIRSLALHYPLGSIISAESSRVTKAKEGQADVIWVRR